MDYQELNLKKGELFKASHLAHIEEGIDTVTAEVAKIKNAKIVLRNDTTENWVAANTVLLKGEPAIEFDENNIAKVKIGDGETPWVDLPYLVTETNPEGGEGEIPEELENRVVVLEETVGGFDLRITNAESGVTAAVLATEDALAKIEEMRAEIAANNEVQNTAIATMQTKVDENTTVVETISTEIEAVKNTQTIQEDKIEAANARVDALVAGFTEEAEFDSAELVDIRAGYDGVVYGSAGAAVRQIGYDLKELSQNLEGALGKDIVDGLAYEGT
jgi:hypothetical protein